MLFKIVTVRLVDMLILMIVLIVLVVQQDLGLIIMTLMAIQYVMMGLLMVKLITVLIL